MFFFFCVHINDLSKKAIIIYYKSINVKTLKTVYYKDHFLNSEARKKCISFPIMCFTVTILFSFLLPVKIFLFNEKTFTLFTQFSKFPFKLYVYTLK